jgi:hypothetical protein
LAAVRPVFEPIFLITKLASFFPAKLWLWAAVSKLAGGSYVSRTCFAAAYCARLDFSAKGFSVLFAFSVAGAISSVSASFFWSADSVGNFLNLLSSTKKR